MRYLRRRMANIENAAADRPQPDNRDKRCLGYLRSRLAVSCAETDRNCPMLHCNTNRVRIVIVDENAGRASIIEEGLSAFPSGEVHVLTDRHDLVSRIAEIEPDIVLFDLGNPARDVLEEYFAVSRALARPIAMFVDESDNEAIAASIDARISAYVVNGLNSQRIRPVLDLAMQRLEAAQYGVRRCWDHGSFKGKGVAHSPNPC